MRFRLVCRWRAAARPLPAAKPAAPALPPAARPASCDNPYGRYYTRARSLEQLRRRES